MDDYQKFIHQSRYARWLPNEKRRETWEETVARYFDFFTEHLATNLKYKVSKDLRKELEDAVVRMDIVPSMRALMTAGPALEREHLAAYNCAYLAVDSPRAFDETLYILMNGTGVGFSVEERYVSQLPGVSERFTNSDTTIVVGDSKQGWASAFRELVNLLYAGQVPKWDLSKVRPAGSPLRTFGGRASGPGPLNDLFAFTTQVFKNAAGRKLTTLECHDIICKTAEIVVVGGVRRSALISLSDLSDDRMRTAKAGAWYNVAPWRALANNSAVYTDTPDIGTFMREWLALYDSKSGERGIFNRQAADRQVAKTGRREVGHEWGTNPCSEIILRSCGLCNLTEVIARENDTLKTLAIKIELATILGTWQSTLTDFGYVRRKWRNNANEERLLGVSITGIHDCPLLVNDPDLQKTLTSFKTIAGNVNRRVAKDLGINESASITCIKPSGTVSQLVDSASGIHSRFSQFYVRTVRADVKDPLTKFLIAQGVPNEPDVTQPSSTVVFSFPIASPSKTTINENALDQLTLWKKYQDWYTEHKPSVTISVNEHEWLQVGAWVYANFGSISGVSFLPTVDHIYQQAPYQAIDAAQYAALKAKMPTIDWQAFSKYEEGDNTVASQELACVGNSCEIVGVGS